MAIVLYGFVLDAETIAELGPQRERKCYHALTPGNYCPECGAPNYITSENTDAKILKVLDVLKDQDCAVHAFKGALYVGILVSAVGVSGLVAGIDPVTPEQVAQLVSSINGLFGKTVVADFEINHYLIW